MKPQDLQHLLVDNLRDTLNAERQIISALPKMIRGTTSPGLVDALKEHLDVTKVQVNRLEKAFQQLGMTARGKHCPGMEGLLEEGSEFLEEAEPGETADAGIIGAAQKVEHYEIAAYGTMIAYARVLGHDGIVRLLEQSLAEEKEADRVLSEIATRSINADAAEGDEGGSEDQERPRRAAGGRSRR